MTNKHSAPRSPARPSRANTRDAENRCNHDLIEGTDAARKFLADTRRYLAA